MADTFDSYTGDPYVEDYQSPIEGIERGRSPFYKDRELQTLSEQYQTVPAAEGWLVHRRGCPATLSPVLPTQHQAVAVMDWLVQNDASVGVAVHWASKQNIEPLIRLLDRIIEVANDNA